MRKKSLLRVAQFSLTACAMFSAALAFAFKGYDNYAMTELCQTALFFVALSGVCGVFKANIRAKD